MKFFIHTSTLNNSDTILVVNKPLDNFAFKYIFKWQKSQLNSFNSLHVELSKVSDKKYYGRLYE
jgi:hypothetical protein